jgi:hypothetical protein
MQIVPGPSPFLFSSSLTNDTPQPFLLQVVPGATETVGSSSSSITGIGLINSGSTCDKVFGVVEKVSFLPSVDDSVTENVVDEGGLGSGALGTSETCPSTSVHPWSPRHCMNLDDTMKTHRNCEKLIKTENGLVGVKAASP